MVLPGNYDDEQLHSECIDKAALSEEEEKVKISVAICIPQDLKKMKNFTSTDPIELHQVKNDNKDFYESGDEIASQIVKKCKHASMDTSISNYSSDPVCLGNTVECDEVNTKYQEANDKSGSSAVSSRESTCQIIVLKIINNQFVECNWLFKWSLKIGIFAKLVFPDSVMSIREHYGQSEDFSFVWDPGGLMWDPGGVNTPDPWGILKLSKPVYQDSKWQDYTEDVTSDIGGGIRLDSQNPWWSNRQLSKMLN
jgi:hypothetical protein